MFPQRACKYSARPLHDVGVEARFVVAEQRTFLIWCENKAWFRFKRTYLARSDGVWMFKGRVSGRVCTPVGDSQQHNNLCRLIDPGWESPKEGRFSPASLTACCFATCFVTGLRSRIGRVWKQKCIEKQLWMILLHHGCIRKEIWSSYSRRTSQEHRYMINKWGLLCFVYNNAHTK